MNRMFKCLSVVLMLSFIKVYPLCWEDTLKKIQLEAEKSLAREFEPFEYGDETLEVLRRSDPLLYLDRQCFDVEVTQRPIIDAQGRCSFIERTVVVKDSWDGVVFEKSTKIKRNFKRKVMRMLEHGVYMTSDILFGLYLLAMGY